MWRSGSPAPGVTAWLGMCVLLASAELGRDALVAQEPVTTECDDPEGHPWVANARDRVMTENELIAFATSAVGDPTSCEGSILVWQGEEYRELALGFGSGTTFTLETMPPGIRIVELTSPGGFGNPDAAVAALRTLTERMGVSIDWSAPEEREVDGVTIEQYWDPEPGLNASASVGRVDGVIVLLRWSIAP